MALIRVTMSQQIVASQREATLEITRVSNSELLYQDIENFSLSESEGYVRDTMAARVKSAVQAVVRAEQGSSGFQVELDTDDFAQKNLGL